MQYVQTYTNTTLASKADYDENLTVIKIARESDRHCFLETQTETRTIYQTFSRNFSLLV